MQSIGSRVSMIATIALFALVFTGYAASAGPLEDIPESFGSALGISTESAKMVLSCLVLVSVAVAVSMASSNMILSTAVVLGFIGMLTAIQWIGAWLLVSIIILLAFLFAGLIKNWAQSDKGD